MQKSSHVWIVELSMYFGSCDMSSLYKKIITNTARWMNVVPHKIYHLWYKDTKKEYFHRPIERHYIFFSFKPNQNSEINTIKMCYTVFWLCITWVPLVFTVSVASNNPSSFIQREPTLLIFLFFFLSTCVDRVFCSHLSPF